MKIASITVAYQDDLFIRRHLEMLKDIDLHIVILSHPFKDYLEAGRVSVAQNNTKELIKDIPNVVFITHTEQFFCGNIFNLGMAKAREFGCDAIIKFDPDMFLTSDVLREFMNIVRNGDYQTLLLDYPNNTIAYKKDMFHGVPAKIFPVGADPLVVKVTQSFIQDGVKIKTTGEQKILNFDGFIVHHFTGLNDSVDDYELRRVERLPGFNGWKAAPDEIINLFK